MMWQDCKLRIEGEKRETREASRLIYLTHHSSA